MDAGNTATESEPNEVNESRIIGLVRGDPTRIPASHLDLVECPPVAALTTLMSDGAPQTSVVWCDFDGTLLRMNTMRGFQKERNLRRDPRVTLLCYDPGRPHRYLEIRGVVESMREEGALEHLDALASKYVGRPVRYFGECIPAHFGATEVPVLCLIRPLRVVAMDASRPAGHRVTRPAPQQHGSAPPGDVPIPDSHRDLLERPICGVLTTLLPDGEPHSCLVWVDHDGACARINTTRQRQSGRDLVRDPRVSLLVVDPTNTARFLQIRGRAELDDAGAVEHLDALTRRYTSHPCYYGHIYPPGQAAREQRVIVRIHARRVTLDAIHA